MAQITEKELTALSDLLGMEQTMHGKCLYLAGCTADAALAAQYEALAACHQRHIDELYGNLK